MPVTVHPLDCGTITANQAGFEMGVPNGSVTIPVPAWLVRHPRGVVLFDTGMHPDLATSSQRLGDLARFFDMTIGDDNTVDGQLRARDVDPGSVTAVALSHLHFDHAGGLGALPNARLLVQRDEWSAGFDDDLAAANSYNTADYDLGHEVQRLDGEHDVFGDSLVTCIPTPGHTPGHQSLRVRLESGEVLLCGDACYFTRTIDGGPLPVFAHDHDLQHRTREHIRALRDAGTTTIPGHDPDVMAALPPELR